MNKTGEKINVEKAVCREMDLQQLHRQVAGSGLARAGSWGFRNGVIAIKDKAYRFTVSGHHHKGHVYIVLNFMDTFDIYYTTDRGTIKKKSEDIYVDEVIDTLDREIELINEYIR